jgi:hypothetical protein
VIPDPRFQQILALTRDGGLASWLVARWDSQLVGLIQEWVTQKLDARLLRCASRPWAKIELRARSFAALMRRP